MLVIDDQAVVRLGLQLLLKVIRRVYAGGLWIERELTNTVIAQIGQGLKNKTIAEKSFFSEITMRHQLTSISSLFAFPPKKKK